MASSFDGIVFTLTEDDDLDCVLVQGCDIYWLLTITDDDAEPIDVTGYDARAVFRPRADGSEIAAEFTVENGRVSIGDEDGAIEFSMNEVDSAALQSGTGVWAVHVTNADGKTWQAQSGKYEISRDITRE